MTLKQIAEAAGVSVATVSKAFSGKKDISEETREAIFAIARDFGCFDKYNKNKYGKKVIAVICPEIISEHYTQIIHILEELIEAEGALMVVSCHNFSDTRTEELFFYYSSHNRADGIILVDAGIKLLKPPAVPAVVIGGSKEECGMDVFEMDNLHGMEEAICRLKALGHTEIGLAGESLTSGAVRLFRAAMEKQNLEILPGNIIVSNRRFEEAGIQAMDEWLRKGSYPTAIIAAYDYIAIGIMKCLKKYDLKVPEDVSVVGINDIGIVSFLEPPLSTVRTYSEEACKAAVSVIMKKMENPYYVCREEKVFKSKFIERASTGPRKER